MNYSEGTFHRLSLSVLMIFVLFMHACGGEGNQNSERQRPNGQSDRANRGTSVEVIEVERSAISQQIRSFGTIKAQELIEITPQVSNRITKIHVDLGDTVRQGQLMAEIYADTYRDQVQQAKAQVEQAKAALQRDSLQFERQRNLYEKELISASEYQNARATYQSSVAQLESNRANLTQALENLSNTDIRSPVYGVVNQRNLSEGDLATTGQAIFTVANLVGLQMRVYLPVDDWEQVEIGQPVRFRVSNKSEATASGSVARISPQLNETTGLGEVVIAVTQTGPFIHQGVLAESIINVQTHPDAVVIPRTALVENVQTLIEPESNTIQLERSYAAFVIENDTTAVRRKLELGLEQGDRVEVLDGLNEGDRLVITGQSSLEDSAKVQIADPERFTRPEGRRIDQASADTSTQSSNRSN
ncbi:MAG: efflux RND transporter periplasmic adaptor subunit [Bacteroidota bacterium]